MAQAAFSNNSVSLDVSPNVGLVNIPIKTDISVGSVICCMTGNSRISYGEVEEQLRTASKSSGKFNYNVLNPALDVAFVLGTKCVKVNRTVVASLYQQFAALAVEVSDKDEEGNFRISPGKLNAFIKRNCDDNSRDLYRRAAVLLWCTCVKLDMSKYNEAIDAEKQKKAKEAQQFTGCCPCKRKGKVKGNESKKKDFNFIKNKNQIILLFCMLLCTSQNSTDVKTKVLPRLVDREEFADLCDSYKEFRKSPKIEFVQPWIYHHGKSDEEFIIGQVKFKIAKVREVKEIDWNDFEKLRQTELEERHKKLFEDGDKEDMEYEPSDDADDELYENDETSFAETQTESVDTTREINVKNENNDN